MEMMLKWGSWVLPLLVIAAGCSSGPTDEPVAAIQQELRCVTTSDCTPLLANPCIYNVACIRGTCMGTLVRDGTTCDDGNVCTQSSACSSGTCVGSNLVKCTALDDCHLAGTCDPVGGCSNPVAPNGTACNQSELCISSSCVSGVCEVEGPTLCDDENPCTHDYCDPAEGCVHPPVAGIPCGDTDPCNGVETCNDAGNCVASDPPMLDDQDACTDDTCDGELGVRHEINPLYTEDGPGTLDFCDPLTGQRSTVTVPPLDRTAPTNVYDSTKFLYEGTNPPQHDVPAGKIELARAAALTGRVINRAGAGISGVSVSIHEDADYGATITQLSGAFDLVVNAGTTYTMSFNKPGYLPVHRKVAPQSNAYRTLDDVVMIPVDTMVTPIQLGASANAWQGALSSISSDLADRQVLVLVPPQTTADLVYADDVHQPITSVNVRATEYTVGDLARETMPADLPATSAYTYAVELSADEVLSNEGAESVAFSNPVFAYVDNFIGFPVGEVVPSGNYDWNLAAWKRSTNGTVIRILSIDDDGVAQVDTTGDDNADNTGLSQGERAYLGYVYEADAELWRVPVEHFSTWDWNWGAGPPSDAIYPETDQIAARDDDTEPTCTSGSIIECQNQALGITVPLSGSPEALTYRSDRVPATARTLGIPLRGAAGPGSVVEILLKIDVAGQKLTLPPIPGSEIDTPYVFVWDGKDKYGHRLSGAQQVKVDIGYVYIGGYMSTPGFGAPPSGGGGGGFLAFIPATLKFTFWSHWTGIIGDVDATGLGYGGWSVSDHHLYDPVRHMLLRGDGSRKIAKASAGQLAPYGGCLVADGCSIGSTLCHPGYTARDCLETEFGNDIRDMQIDAQGNVVFLDYVSNSGFTDPRVYIRRFTSAGHAETLFGTYDMSAQSLADGESAVGRKLPTNLKRFALGPDGSIYFGVYYPEIDDKIWRITPDGIAHVIGGGGPSNAPSDGDDGPATDAYFEVPAVTDVGSDGTAYIFENASGRYRVRTIAPDGTVSRVAGSGAPCHAYAPACGDGGDALAATLGSMSDVKLGPNGMVYIAHGTVVRRIGTNGVISTFAGSIDGSTDLLTDGIDALLADISPVRMSFDGNANLVFSDHVYNLPGHDRIRSVTPEGIIWTSAGTGETLKSDERDGGGALDPAVQPHGCCGISGWRRVLRGVQQQCFRPFCGAQSVTRLPRLGRGPVLDPRRRRPSRPRVRLPRQTSTHLRRGHRGRPHQPGRRQRRRTDRSNHRSRWIGDHHRSWHAVRDHLSRPLRSKHDGEPQQRRAGGDTGPP